MPIAPEFTCFRYWVALGEAPCTLKRCVHYAANAPGCCALVDPCKEHSAQEIAARLGATEGDVQRDIRTALVKGRRAVLVRDMNDGVAD